jgi:hypothetical protein
MLHTLLRCDYICESGVDGQCNAQGDEIGVYM